MTDCNCNQGRLPCTCRTDNSDGTSPHAEVRELLLDGVYVVGALAALIFVIFALLGYWSRA